MESEPNRGSWVITKEGRNPVNKITWIRFVLSILILVIGVVLDVAGEALLKIHNSSSWLVVTIPIVAFTLVVTSVAILFRKFKGFWLPAIKSFVYFCSGAAVAGGSLIAPKPSPHLVFPNAESTTVILLAVFEGFSSAIEAIRRFRKDDEL